MVQDVVDDCDEAGEVAGRECFEQGAGGGGPFVVHPLGGGSTRSSATRSGVIHSRTELLTGGFAAVPVTW